MIDFFKGSDGGSDVISLCSSKDWGGSVENGSVGNGIGISGMRSGAVKVVIHSNDKEVEVREERRVLVKVCKVR